MKSPVASLCFVCSSVRKRVRVTISYLICSSITVDAVGFDIVGLVVSHIRDICFTQGR